MSSGSSSTAASIELVWRGPHLWPRAGRQPRVDDLEAGGVYLFTVEHQGGFLVYCAGHTRHFRKRFRQHDRLYRNGTYTIFDREAFESARREKVWVGFWSRKNDKALREEYAQRSEAIVSATERWLDGYRVFVAHADIGERMRKRLEAALMQCFYTAPAPICDMPDKGMSLSSRWPSEAVIRVRNTTAVTILGLPLEMEA